MGMMSMMSVNADACYPELLLSVKHHILQTAPCQDSSSPSPVGIAATARNQQQPEAARSSQKWPLVASGGFWRPLMASGGFWWPLVAFGGFWWPPPATTSHQQPPATSRSRQKQLEVASGGLWWLLAASGSTFYPISHAARKEMAFDFHFVI